MANDKPRLYYGKLLRSIRYSPAWQGKDAFFEARLTDHDLRIHLYKADSIDGVLLAIKADGWQVWGTDTLDYALPPENALEYLLMVKALKANDVSDDEIKEWFSLTE